MRKSCFFVGFFACFLLGCMHGCTPKKITVAEMRAQKRAKDSISYLQQCQSLQYYDSVLQITLPTIDPMLKAFRFEQNATYEDHGHYVHRLLRTDANTQRNFLQVYVRDDNKVIVRACYCGASPLRMHAITLTADSVTATFAGLTHSFEAEGWHESLTLEGENALEFLRFINTYAPSRIRVSLQGEKTGYQFYISDNDKQAILDTFQLATTMNDIVELEKMVRQTSIQVEKYKKRLKILK